MSKHNEFDELDAADEDEGGIAADVFLHMVDAWVESKLDTLTPAKIDAAMRKLDVFTAAMGDRFEDAAHLERAFAEWTAHVGARTAKACVVVVDTLAFWRAVEKMEAEEQGA